MLNVENTKLYKNNIESLVNGLNSNKKEGESLETSDTLSSEIKRDVRNTVIKSYVNADEKLAELEKKNESLKSERANIESSCNFDFKAYRNNSIKLAVSEKDIKVCKEYIELMFSGIGADSGETQVNS